MATLTSLPREVLQDLFDFLLGDSSINLLRCGDRTLLLKLASLRRLRIVLGQSGGFLSFDCVYALLSRFTALESLSISAFDHQQLWKKKLKPRLLPTSLKSLTLAFHDAVYAYLTNAKLYSSLPGLHSLTLQQSRHKSIREATTPPRLSLGSIPASIHHLRILGVFAYYYHADLERLSSNLCTFECEGRMENTSYSRAETHVDLSRFRSLSTLNISFGSFISLSSNAYPSSLTSLRLGGLGNTFQLASNFHWASAFPSLQSLHVYTPDVQIKWLWLLDLPVTMRHISGNMQAFNALSEAERCDLLITLNARNDNYKRNGLSFADQPLLVPSLLRTLTPTSAPLPLALISIFTEIEVLELLFDAPGPQPDPYVVILHQTAFDGVFAMNRLKKLILRGPVHTLKIPRDVETGKELGFPSTLESFHWSGAELPPAFWTALPSTLRELDMLKLCVGDSLKRFTQLTSLPQLSTPEGMHTSSAQLNDLLPESVTLLNLDWIDATEPLRLPNLTSLGLHWSGVNLAWIATLPPSLTQLRVSLKEPIDVTNSAHRAALLSFPRNLKRLHLKKGPDFMKVGGSVSGGLMVERNTVVNGEHVSPAAHLLQLKEENTYLELMTRNLNLVRLKVSFVPISGTYGPISYQTKHEWLTVRVPFWRTLYPDYVPPRALSTDGVYKQRVAALARTNISYVKSLSLGTFSRFQQLYYAARNMVMPGVPAEVIPSKITLRNAPQLHWHWLTLYYLTTIAIYGVRYYMGSQTFIGRLWNGPKLDLSFGGITHSPRSSLATFQQLYIDLNFASAVIGLPMALTRLGKEKSAKWSRDCPAPHTRYIGAACFALGIIFGLPYTPLTGYLLPVVAVISEVFILQSTSWLNFAGKLSGK